VANVLEQNCSTVLLKQNDTWIPMLGFELPQFHMDELVGGQKENGSKVS